MLLALQMTTVFCDRKLSKNSKIKFYNESNFLLHSRLNVLMYDTLLDSPESDEHEHMVQIEFCIRNESVGVLHIHKL
jgi:hypothetical protein